MQCALRRLERHEWRETAQLLRTLADWTDEVVALEARCLTVTADIERIQRGQTTMNLPLGPAVARHP
ncbi:hypothetical protein OpiT1DRAFT_04764 [Opitutaceae bacterium TAV1]|nr:hypothetical protein OpiT1DRAFT_04764 [Opitutaceae bacterium TAV1]